MKGSIQQDIKIINIYKPNDRYQNTVFLQYLSVGYWFLDSPQIPKSMYAEPVDMKPADTELTIFQSKN